MTAELLPASDFCQRWSDRQHSWRHRSDGGFDPARYTVEQIDELTAKGYIVRHHYSASYPSAKYRFGLFEAGELVGVLVYSIPMQDAVLTNPFPDLEPTVESIELGRLVLADEVPANGESWFVARCGEEAAARGVRGVVSFSDPLRRIVDGQLTCPGHIGVVYQASNATYTGRGAPQTMTILPTGEVLNNRAKSKVRGQEMGHEHVERKLVALGARPLRAGEQPAEWLARAMDDVGVVRVRHRGNFRYCFTLGTRSQRRAVRLATPSLPYPKELDAA